MCFAGICSVVVLAVDLLYGFIDPASKQNILGKGRKTMSTSEIVLGEQLVLKKQSLFKET